MATIRSGYRTQMSHSGESDLSLKWSNLWMCTAHRQWCMFLTRALLLGDSTHNDYIPLSLQSSNHILSLVPFILMVLLQRKQDVILLNPFPLGKHHKSLQRNIWHWKTLYSIQVEKLPIDTWIFLLLLLALAKQSISYVMNKLLSTGFNFTLKCPVFTR